MQFPHLIIGLFFIGIGFLVKRFPDLISCYGTMSKEQKKNVDIAGLSSWMKKGLIVIGGIIMVAPILLKIFQLEEFTSLTMILVILPGTMIMSVFAQKYDHNKRKYKSLVYILFLGIITLFVCIMLFLPFVPTTTIFNEETIQFTGSYGFTLNISDIKSIELSENRPQMRRTNGVSIAYIDKGHYSSQSWGKCRLLINSNEPPYLIITKNNSEKIIMNNKEKSVTEDVYKQIQFLLVIKRTENNEL